MFSCSWWRDSCSEATSERDDSQTNGELNSANRIRAIGIRDLRRSEVQLVMHRTCAHLRGRRRYVPSRACWGSCANKFIYWRTQDELHALESTLRNAKLILEVEKLQFDTNAREKTKLRNFIPRLFPRTGNNPSKYPYINNSMSWIF